MASQYGVVSRHQLRSDLGWTSSRLGRARAAGLFVEAAPGVVRMASDRGTFESACMAAQLAARSTGFLGAWTAGRLYRMRRMPDRPIHLTTRSDFRLTVGAETQVHRSRWYDEADVAIRVDGLRIATPLRALFGMAARFNQFRFERAAEDAWHLGLVTPAQAAIYLEQHRCRGKDGVATMERWLERAVHRERPSQSELERDLIEALRSVGLPEPDRQHPVVLLSGETVHIDIAWPIIRFGVEPGASWWHGGDLGQRLDQDRDRACGEVGWFVVRFDEAMRRDPGQSARQVRRIFDRRANDLRATG